MTKTNEQSPSVRGGVRTWLRLEGLAVLTVAVVLYGRSGASFIQFAALFLLPDLSLFGYLAGPAVGAPIYNTVHSTIGPLALFLLGTAGVLPATVVPFALIWWAHTGFDRALGYGLKY